MKFYKYSRNINAYYITLNELTCIYNTNFLTLFYYNGNYHNHKNMAYIGVKKEFYLNGICYGNENKFTKSSWRKFAKLQAFL